MAFDNDVYIYYSNIIFISLMNWSMYESRAQLQMVNRPLPRNFQEKPWNACSVENGYLYMAMPPRIEFDGCGVIICECECNNNLVINE